MENKLIPMTSFVLHLHSMTTSELCKEYPNRFKMPAGIDKDKLVKQFLAIDAIKWDMAKEYAKFLSQPLTLSMFVPVSESGEDLQDPGFPNERASDDEISNWRIDKDKYEKAKERCLFEGWKYIDEYQIEKDNVTILFGAAQFIIEGNLGLSGGNIYPETLEGLSRTELDLSLSPNALKHIYG